MSSISQMERSSSQTRMLPTRSSSRRHGTDGFKRPALQRRGNRIGQSLTHREAAQSQHKHAALSQLGAGENLAFVGLHNFVPDRQSQPGAAGKLRLEWLEYFFDELLAHPRPSVGEIELPVFST